MDIFAARGLLQAIREHNRLAEINKTTKFDYQQLETLYDFVHGHVPEIKRSEWHRSALGGLLF